VDRKKKQERTANTPPLVVADMRSGFNNVLFFSDRFGLEKLEYPDIV